MKINLLHPRKLVSTKHTNPSQYINKLGVLVETINLYMDVLGETPVYNVEDGLLFC